MKKQIINKRDSINWLITSRPDYKADESMPRLQRCFFLLLSLLTCSFTAEAVIPASERAVLTSIYASTNGAGWTSSFNWNGPIGTECTWYGVRCNAAGTNVDAIFLNNSKLAGTLPSISDLSALLFFNVHENQLTGPIPPLVGLLALQSLSLYNNQLTGQIPAISGLTALQSFQVFNNQLSGPIPSLSGLTALRFFSVNGNQLSGQIPAISGLPALQFFHIFNNQLSGPMPSLSGLTALQQFTAFNNRLSGPIPSLNGLTSLQNLTVTSNQLSGQIPSLNGLTGLQHLDLANNQISGSIPALNGLPMLQTFQVGTNQLTGPVPVAPTTLLAGRSNLCGNRLISSGSANDSAWIAAQNVAVIAGGNWLACQTAVAVNPVFPLVVTGSITPTVANINAAIQYRPQDVGTTGSVYVFALAPASMVKNVSAEALMNHKGPVTRSIGTADTPLPCVLAQLTASGQLTAVTASTLQSFLTGVLSSQGASVSVLNGVSTALVSGAVFYVGYGANSAAMLNNGIHRNVVTVPGANVCAPQAPQTGWWWNPAEDGRGFGIEVRGNTLFMSGYLYDQSGNATWVVSAGPAALDGSFFNNTLYHVSNGQTLTGAYKAPAPVTLDGPITLSFTDARTGTLIWPGGSIPIQRFDTIIGSGNGITPAFVPENGWWWNEAESGRGFFMEFKNNFAFIAGYMYETDGKPVWYTAQKAMTTPQTFSSNWLQVANGQTLTGPYKAPVIINSNVGPVTIQFSDAANALLTLPTGRQVAITRHRF